MLWQTKSYIIVGYIYFQLLHAFVKLFVVKSCVTMVTDQWQNEKKLLWHFAGLKKKKILTI